MRVTVNGKTEEFASGTTVAGMVARYEFDPKHIAIEINCDLVPRRSFDTTDLKEGDQVEIVTLVGGG